MATFTITTPVNIDSLTAKAGGDTYAINGGYLTVDQDSRYGVNAHLSASMGPITLNAASGGTIEFNSTLVRLIPFSAGSGAIPAQGATISQGSASGKFLACFTTALNAAPLTGSASMPSTGWVKIKQWNSSSFAAGALTGITATATGPDVAGWLEIVGTESTSITCNRLGLFKVRGNWFNVGTTTGVNTSTYQIPSNGSQKVYLPGVWVETSPAAGVYEFYPSAGSQTALLANIATDQVRGRFCWISVSGTLSFQNDGTNLTGGYLPLSGSAIRIPNIFFTTCAAAAGSVNVIPNATLATRPAFVTTGGGVLDIDKACFNWYLNTDQTYSFALTNTAVMSTIVLSEVATPIAWYNVGVGQEAATANFGLNMSLCFAGGTLDHCTWSSATLAASGRYVLSKTDINGFTFTNQRGHALAARGNATTGDATITRAVNCSWNNRTTCGQTVLTTCTNLAFSGSTYYDNPATTTTSVDPQYAFALSTNCLNVKIDGLDFGGLTLVQPYSGVISIAAAGCANIKLRNLGTYASPLDMGGTQVNDAVWSRASAVATVTYNNHGLKTGDIIYVKVSSDTSAITVAAKTLTGATANTFTFACTNAGSLSGTLNYYPTMAATLAVIAGAAAANNIEVKRCYTPHLRTNMFTADNSSKNVVFKNVQADYINVPLNDILNETFTGVFAAPSLAAQTSIYGTHWFDCFIDPVLSQSTVPWSRITTAATLTASNHGLRTGDIITVLSCSANAGQAINLGQTAAITVTTSSFINFTCTNSGLTNGKLIFTPLGSKIGIQMNEASTDTTSQYAITDLVGTAGFTAAGGLYMPTVGQTTIFTTPDYILGHTGFAAAKPVMAGGTIGNYNIWYALDKNDGNSFGTGSLSGSWHNMYFNRPGAGGTSGLFNITMTSTYGVEVGDYIFGTNVAPNAQVVSVTNGTTVSASYANIGAVSGILAFCHLPVESGINAQNGLKMQVQITTSTTNATAMTSLFAYTLSDDTSRAWTYPLDLNPLTITGLQNPTEVRVYDAANPLNLIASNTSVTSGTFSTTIDVAAYPAVDVSILSLGYQNIRLLSQTIGTGLTVPVSQIIDRQYVG